MLLALLVVPIEVVPVALVCRPLLLARLSTLAALVLKVPAAEVKATTMDIPPAGLEVILNRPFRNIGTVCVT